MTNNTINDAVTMNGDGKTVLMGRYRILRQLGQGGMGSVWLAEDIKLDNKLFAIKMLPSVLIANKRAYRQLKDEALVAMKLVHPNIVTLRAFEETDGNPFLVMDYIEGKTLDECLEEWGKLSEEQTVALLNPIAAAIDYAHSEGVVHRDIKPGNIMIRNDGKPFILDFGIAREVKETLTQVTGKLSSGTLLYMSPEQLTGDMPKPAQDVYSFAAMAYECINGTPPFSRGQVEYQIIHKEPEPLPEGSGITVSIMRGLAKTPDARPKTCTGVLRALQRPQVKKTVLPIKKAEVPKVPVQSSGEVRVVGIIGLILLLFVGGVLWYQTYLDKESAGRKLSELQRKELARLEETRKAEAKRQEEARRADEQRKQAEQKRLEEEARRQRAEAERKEKERKLAEQQAENERLEHERKLAKRRAEAEREAREAVASLTGDSSRQAETAQLVSEAEILKTESELKAMEDDEKHRLKAEQQKKNAEAIMQAINECLDAGDEGESFPESVVAESDAIKEAIKTGRSLFCTAEDRVKKGDYDSAATDFEAATAMLQGALDRMQKILCEIKIAAYVILNGEKKYISPIDYEVSISGFKVKHQRNKNIGADELIVRTFNTNGKIFTLTIWYGKFEAIIPIQRVPCKRQIEVELK